MSVRKYGTSPWRGINDDSKDKGGTPSGPLRRENLLNQVAGAEGTPPQLCLIPIMPALTGGHLTLRQ
jgi:hypothetical protein